MDRKPYYGSEYRSSRSAAPSRPRSANHSASRAPAPANRRSNSGYSSGSRYDDRYNSRYDERYDDRYSVQDRRRVQDSYRTSRNPGNAPQRAPAPRRRRQKDPLSVIIPIAVVLCILIGGIYLGSAWITSAFNKSTYCDNVYVNGIDVNAYSKEEGIQQVRDQIAARLNTPYTLSWADQSWTISAADFDASIDTDILMERAWNIGHVGNFLDRAKSIRALKKYPIYLEAQIRYDESKIDALVDTIYDAVYLAPVDATVLVDLDQPFLTGESSRGQELDRETARAQIISLIETGEGSQVLPIITLEPQLTTEAAMSTLEIIVEYKTDTSARGYNSRFNIRKGLSPFNGMEVKPGESVDFNEVVGPRTEERGWQKGTEYVGDGTTKEDFGGGICQASTTLYGAVLKAGMTILSRSPHSMTVSYVEPSLDAAVTNTSSKNLVFRNDTENSIFIYTEVTKENATVTIRGKRPPYRYELYSNVVSQDTSAVRVSYIDDTEGRYCYFKTDPPVLYKKGRAACSSDSYLIAYDWETGEEVSSTWLSHDQYDSGTDIYWRGVHSPDEVAAPAAASGGGMVASDLAGLQMNTDMNTQTNTQMNTNTGITNMDFGSGF